MFFKDLRITLYEIFGYLLPGVVMLAALSVLMFELCFPKGPLPFLQPRVDGWIIILFVAYLVGHVAQTIAEYLSTLLKVVTKLIGNIEESDEEAGGNKLADKMPTSQSSERTKKFLGVPVLDEGIVTAVSQAVRRIFGIKERMTQFWLLELCDETVLQRGNAEMREVFEYREGFYRGMAVSFLFLAISLGVWFLTYPSYEFMNKEHTIPNALLFALVASIVAVPFMGYRYIRFLQHRITAVFLGTLAIARGQRPTRDLGKA